VGIAIVLIHPSTTVTDGAQPNWPNVGAHSPTARVVGSTAGGGSFVMTGFWGVPAERIEALVLSRLLSRS